MERPVATSVIAARLARVGSRRLAHRSCGVLSSGVALFEFGDPIVSIDPIDPIDPNFWM
jgi:hypothetical protein